MGCNGDDPREPHLEQPMGALQGVVAEDGVAPAWGWDLVGVEIRHGDCVEVMATLEPDSISAAVTDPPYHLTSIVKRFGAANAAPAKSNGATGVYGRASKGFMGKQWDGGDVAFRPETWAAVYRVLKPGAYLLAFGGMRTYHRLACAIEDAGFEIRDTIMWLYGSGFPKSHDVSKAIDRIRGDDCRHVTAFLREHRGAHGLTAIARALGFEATAGTHGTAAFFSEEARLARVPTIEQWRLLKALFGFGDEMDAEIERLNFRKGQPGEAYLERPAAEYDSRPGMAESWRDGKGWTGTLARGGYAIREDAAKWQGWGTALKPACEPIVVARKPLSEGSVAANVLRHGTGALNIDASRVAVAPGDRHEYGVDGDEPSVAGNGVTQGHRARVAYKQHAQGRWPANVAHSGEPEVLEAFARFGERTTGGGDKRGGCEFFMNGDRRTEPTGHEPNAGTAARFFFCAKASTEERVGSHPTVKPIALMEWLVGLVTPPGGRVLDPFCGSGSTLVACDRLGLDALGIEADAQTVMDAEEKIRRFRARRAIGNVDERPRPLPGQTELGL